MVGFGVRDFKPSKAFLDRYNQEVTVGDFLDWCQPRLKEIKAFVPESDRVRRTMLDVSLMLREEEENPSRLDDLLTASNVIYDDEFGFEDALVFVPLGMESWRRYNDSIDWAEETQFHGQQRRFTWLDRELHPYPFHTPPLTVAALAMYFGVPEVWSDLKECLYVMWG